MEAVFYSREFFHGLRDKIQTDANAQQSLEQLQERVRELADKPFDIPLTGGGWSHAYNCPDDGSYLQLVDRRHHKCPVCGKIWSGSPWDETAVANEHWNYSMRCKEAAILYGITQEDHLLSWCRKILFFYTEHYQNYPFHDKIGGAGKTGGKVQCQTLSEASWIIPLAETCYILRQYGAITNDELSRMKNELFLPAAQVIKGNPVGKSNWQTYHNAAKIWIGVALDEQSFVEEAIQDPDHGFLFQMENSLANDGFWYEGAWGYHFYTLTAQVLIVSAALTKGIRLVDHPRFRLMFEAPLNCMFPDATLPAVHDSGEVNVTQNAPLYEFAYHFFGIGTEVLAKSERISLYRLLFGSKLQQEAGKSRANSAFLVANLEKAGMIFAKQLDAAGQPQQVVMLDYGEHGGGHGHYDKLNLLYYANGQNWITDAGFLPYANPLHSAWFRQTIAHNTVVISGKSQQEATGKLLSVQERDGNLQIQTAVHDAYPGVNMQRTVTLTPSYVIDRFEVACENFEDIDWVFHTPAAYQAGKGIVLRAVDPSELGTTNGYQHLQQVASLDGLPAEWMLEWQVDEADKPTSRLQVYGIYGEPAEQFYLAKSPAMPQIGTRSTLIRRVNHSKTACFTTVIRSCEQSDGPLNLQDILNNK